MEQGTRASSPSLPQPFSWSQLLKGVSAMTPLSIAVLPWGLLAGSYAVEVGLTPLEAQAMSAILFAGALQLVASGLFKIGVSIWVLLITTFFITSRHFLYSVAMREKISPLPWRWRLLMGFLLTDELFAICGQQKKSQFNVWYALGGGFSFYIIWNIASFVGIVAGKQIPNLDQWGLEFAVAATFIAIVIPSIKTSPILISVVVALVSSVALHYLQLEIALVLASLLGMLAGYIAERYQHKRQTLAAEPKVTINQKTAENPVLNEPVVNKPVANEPVTNEIKTQDGER